MIFYHGKVSHAVVFTTSEVMSFVVVNLVRWPSSRMENWLKTLLSYCMYQVFFNRSSAVMPTSMSETNWRIKDSLLSIRRSTFWWKSTTYCLSVESNPFVFRDSLYALERSGQKDKCNTCVWTSSISISIEHRGMLCCWLWFMHLAVRYWLICSSST